MAPAAPTAIPLLVSFNQVVVGNGFVAGVQVNGRALQETEADGEVWITGVAPVGFAAGGADRGDAFQKFRSAWSACLFDIVAEAKSFADFKRDCEAFLGSQQDSITALWQSAVDAVRSTGYTDPSLPRANADSLAVAYMVMDLTGAQTAAANALECGLQAA
jgi:hypothetical protein